MSPPSCLDHRRQVFFPLRQVFWLWDDLTPGPFPSFAKLRTVVHGRFRIPLQRRVRSRIARDSLFNLDVASRSPERFLVLRGYCIPGR